MTKILTVDTDIRCEISGKVYQVISATLTNDWIRLDCRDKLVVAFHRDNLTMTPVE